MKDVIKISYFGLLHDSLDVEKVLLSKYFKIQQCCFYLVSKLEDWE